MGAAPAQIGWTTRAVGVRRAGKGRALGVAAVGTSRRVRPGTGTAAGTPGHAALAFAPAAQHALARVAEKSRRHAESTRTLCRTRRRPSCSCEPVATGHRGAARAFTPVFAAGLASVNSLHLRPMRVKLNQRRPISHPTGILLVTRRAAPAYRRRRGRYRRGAHHSRAALAGPQHSSDLVSLGRAVLPPAMRRPPHAAARGRTTQRGVSGEQRARNRAHVRHATERLAYFGRRAEFGRRADFGRPAGRRGGQDGHAAADPLCGAAPARLDVGADGGGVGDAALFPLLYHLM
eukprot:scaffold15634_cov84-Isochrysis_galbana.AAC.1